MTLDEARTLANINERAKRLFTEEGGYYYEPMEGIEDIFYVHKHGQPISVWYLVTIGTSQRCTCACFQKLRTCKHLLAVTYAETERLQQEAAEIASYEERYRDAEHSVWGCDPDYRLDRQYAF